jgi:hypothetical protein
MKENTVNSFLTWIQALIRPVKLMSMTKIILNGFLSTQDNGKFTSWFYSYSKIVFYLPQITSDFYLRDYTELHPSRFQTSYSPPWEPEISHDNENL